MKLSLEEEARIHAGLNKGFDYEEEAHYQPGKINAYKSFQDGANSKWVQAEKIKAQIEIVEMIANEFNEKYNIVAFDRTIMGLKEQLKELEDESKID